MVFEGRRADKKELYLTILAENLLEILIALGFGVAASIGVCILLSMNMSELPIHLLPVGELIFSFSSSLRLWQRHAGGRFVRFTDSLL